VLSNGIACKPAMLVPEIKKAMKTMGYNIKLK